MNKIKLIENPMRFFKFNSKIKSPRKKKELTKKSTNPATELYLPLLLLLPQQQKQNT